MLWKFGLRKLGLRSRITSAAETEPVKKTLAYDFVNPMIGQGVKFCLASRSGGEAAIGIGTWVEIARLKLNTKCLSERVMYQISWEEL